MTPEAQARERIDRKLEAAGWIIHSLLAPWVIRPDGQLLKSMFNVIIY